MIDRLKERIRRFRYSRQIKTINKREAYLSSLSNIVLKKETEKLLLKINKRFCRKKRLKRICNTVIINKAFSLVREVSKRILGLRHFDIQLLGGLVLNDRKIAEMKTGEGKTIVAMLPVYLNSLCKNGVHVVTVNDYLSHRDSKYVGQVYKFLDLTVGTVTEFMTLFQKRKGYKADVTYLTNSELGFDYLKDNLAFYLEELIQRSFYYCVIDEIDSVLIDEARIPLVISKSSGLILAFDDKVHDEYRVTAQLVNFLQRDIHYKVDEKVKSVMITNKGAEFCEKVLGITELYSQTHSWTFRLLNSLKAKELFTCRREYMVAPQPYYRADRAGGRTDGSIRTEAQTIELWYKQQEYGKIIIIDSYTGRPMDGRRWVNGLHAAIEAKEGVRIEEELRTRACISYQSLFSLYPNISGMTGTAATEKEEFKKTYNLSVVSIPTNKPVLRIDYDDQVYQRQYHKWLAISRDLKSFYGAGRPVLVGTSTVKSSELVADLLRTFDIPFQLLNANPENAARESEIIAQAGRMKTITIATNMAGRGTDIKLGGISPGNQKQEKKTVIQLGGLHVIGTQRHESRRIDNQLRGRAGRQGNPGSSVFFLSLKDSIFDRFGGKNLFRDVSSSFNALEIPIRDRFITRTIKITQKKIESYYYESRKQMLEYDRVLDQQREIMYADRRKTLRVKNFKRALKTLTEQVLFDVITRLEFIQFKDGRVVDGNEGRKSKVTFLRLQNLCNIPFCDYYYQNLGLYYNLLVERFDLLYKDIEEEFVAWKRNLNDLERNIFLEQMDETWSDHLQEMTLLVEDIRWVNYGMNPLAVYKQVALKRFIDLMIQVRHRVIYVIYRVIALRV